VRAVKEVALTGTRLPLAAASFLACVATIVECPIDELPQPGPGEDPARDAAITRWLGGFGLGLVPVADPSSFAWPGPWIARLRAPAFDAPRAVVMYGVPSGIVWDPSGASGEEGWSIADGFIVSVTDVALARPSRPSAPVTPGTIEAIWVAPDAQAPPRPLETVTVVAGRGLRGDRYLDGTGSFASGPPGSALTLIDAGVCESFSPPLAAGEHRRNVVTRGIDLNALVGREFTLGAVSCRGMRLCEPCSVLQRSAERPLLRPLVHRGGLRADILADGTISVGDPVRCTQSGEPARTGPRAPD
jgi:hypothetical protein